MRKKHNSIINIIEQLEKLMYGHNYQVTFGIDVFDNCPSLNDFKINLKKKKILYI